MHPRWPEMECSFIHPRPTTGRLLQPAHTPLPSYTYTFISFPFLYYTLQRRSCLQWATTPALSFILAQPKPPCKTSSLKNDINSGPGITKLWNTDLIPVKNGGKKHSIESRNETVWYKVYVAQESLKLMAIFFFFFCGGRLGVETGSLYVVLPVLEIAM